MNLSITNECNRRCEYCFQKTWYLSNKKEDIKEMSLETIENILNMMDEKEEHFKIMGGEPLLYSKLFDLLELAKSKKKTITIISNITAETSIIERIINDYSDVVKGWLINSDYPESHESLFTTNLKLFKDNEYFSLSTTLLPDSNKVLESANRIIKLIELLDDKNDINVRVSPMAPNHVNDGFYDYSLDIIHFIETLWTYNPQIKISFDCPLNCCELHPQVLDMFDRSPMIEYHNNTCSGCGPFDILVDNSVIYCSSTYDIIRLDNIFDYTTIHDAKKAMFLQWKNYWKTHQIACDYKSCEHFNPTYCMGLCPAKNNLKLKS